MYQHDRRRLRLERIIDLEVKRLELQMRHRQAKAARSARANEDRRPLALG